MAAACCCCCWDSESVVAPIWLSWLSRRPPDMLEPPEPADNLPPTRSWLLRPDPRPPPPPLLSPPKLPIPAMEAWEELSMSTDCRLDTLFIRESWRSIIDTLFIDTEHLDSKGYERLVGPFTL